MPEVGGDPIPDVGVEGVAIPVVAAAAEEVVLGDDTGDRACVVADGRLSRGCIGGQLELGAALGRIVGADVFEIDVAAGLVIHHDQLTGASPVDPVDRAAHRQSATVGQGEADRTVATEAQLGADHVRTAGCGGVSVECEPGDQIGQYGLPVE